MLASFGLKNVLETIKGHWSKNIYFCLDLFR